MTLYTLFLFLHILGALITGIFIVLAIISLLKNTSQRYTPVAKNIAVLTIVQIITGSLLSLHHTEISTLTYCSRISMYIGLVVTIELLLFLKVRKEQRQIFPLKFVSTTFVLSLLLMSITVINL